MEPEQLRGVVIPGALDGLRKSCTDLQQIAEWCKNAGETEQNSADVFRQTQDYVKNALSNVAFHIHTVATHLTTYLQYQALEVEQMDWHMRVLIDRMRLSHDAAGMNGLRTLDAAAKYKKQEKMRKVPDAPLAQALPRYVRRTLDLNVLNNVGMDLSGNRGTDAFGNLSGAPTGASMSQYPPMSGSGPAPSGPPSAMMAPPRVQPPKTMPTAPTQTFQPGAPAQFQGGYSSGGAPPPPPQQQQQQYQEQYDDMPPPPPDDDGPPPPPPRMDYGDDPDAPPPPPR